MRSKGKLISEFRIFSVLVVFALFLSGCTINKRYHFHGYNWGGKVSINHGSGEIRAKSKMDPGSLKQNRSLLKSNSSSSKVLSAEIEVQKTTLTNNKPSFPIASMVNGKEKSWEGHHRSSKKNQVGVGSSQLKREPSAMYSEKKPFHTSYIDSSDPETWAVVFYILFVVAGLLALITELPALKFAAVLALLIAIICTLLCQGEYYYTFTKVMMVITSIFFIYMGWNFNFFD